MVAVDPMNAYNQPPQQSQPQQAWPTYGNTEPQPQQPQPMPYMQQPQQAPYSIQQQQQPPQYTPAPPVQTRY